MNKQFRKFYRARRQTHISRHSGRVVNGTSGHRLLLEALRPVPSSPVVSQAALCSGFPTESPANIKGLFMP